MITYFITLPHACPEVLAKKWKYGNENGPEISLGHLHFGFLYRIIKRVYVHGHMSAGPYILPERSVLQSIGRNYGVNDPKSIHF